MKTVQPPSDQAGFDTKSAARPNKVLSSARRTCAWMAVLCLSAGIRAQDAPSASIAPAGPDLGSIDPAVVSAKRPLIEVVFALDTTGSMQNLIEGAKRKIWSIASHLATGTPAPRIRIGLVGYRDRGDEYVTRVVALDEDLDKVYEQLMSFVAHGGGDEPESVNQALLEAVDAFDWDRRAETLKIIYLVGDAPPHMDYSHDALYADTCRRAAEHGIIINTIQCGSVALTAPIWQEIARRSEGEYFAIDQGGGMVAVATPFDEELSSLGDRLTSTLVHYGSGEELETQWSKADCSARISEVASTEAKADRAVYNSCDAGLLNLTGAQELVNDVCAGRVKLADIPVAELPVEMQKMSAVEREKDVEEKARARAELQQKIQELGAKRADFIRDQIKELNGDAFDRKVIECLERQAAKKGIEYQEPADAKTGSPQESSETTGSPATSEVAGSGDKPPAGEPETKPVTAESKASKEGSLPNRR